MLINLLRQLLLLLDLLLLRDALLLGENLQEISFLRRYKTIGRKSGATLLFHR